MGDERSETTTPHDRGGCRCLICAGGATDTVEPRKRRTVATVERYGHQCTTVGASQPDGLAPPYGFTSGMWHSYRQPELAIYGIGGHEVMTHTLNTVADRTVALGRQAEHDDRFSGVLNMPGVAVGGYWLMLAQVHPSWLGSQFGISLEFNAGNQVDFLQVVWPDAEGRYPGEPGFDEALADRQPLLWLPVHEHPPSVWLTAEVRGVIPSGLRRDLADSMASWEARPLQPDATATALARLARSVGSTLNWIYDMERGRGDVIPPDVVYALAKAFVAWDQRSPAESDGALGERLHHAGRVALDLGGTEPQ
ncbi:DUF4262 domain-containing protein [Mycolicibacterium frederiksbergense]|uniref:DUF4262 domain-containing protein n=1 Tax=Mycolicibacterium frederiksbergense TaxID=117567 RepID=UPI0014391A4B|nr:DUF4262 domain-containing protein [Mycolicibacterium frederiksbergense]